MAEVTTLLLGCVKTKLERGAPAKDLYCSALWRGRRRHAESLGRPWVVLSAPHGLVGPEQYLEPYDLALSQLSAAARTAWGARVVDQLAARLRLEKEAFEVHAGAHYLKAIEVPLQERGASVTAPLAGLKLGPQLAWYRDH